MMLKRLLEGMAAIFTPPPPYEHPLADKRRDLADELEGLEGMDRWNRLEQLAKEDGELYASWLQEIYPGPGDKI